jgi:hypothetical protein
MIISLLVTLPTKNVTIKVKITRKPLIRYRLRDGVANLELAKNGIIGKALVKTSGASY